MARPFKYIPERIEKIAQAIEQGDKCEVAARKAGVSPTQFYEWQAKKPEFAERIKAARAKYEEWELNGILEDAKKSLKVLVCGLEYDETKTEYEQDPKRPDAPRIKKMTTTHKKVLPSPTAVIFALCNRDPEHWQNRVSQEISGKLDTDGRTEVSLAKVPDELLAQVIDAINGSED